MRLEKDSQYWEERNDLCAGRGTAKTVSGNATVTGTISVSGHSDYKRGNVRATERL